MNNNQRNYNKFKRIINIITKPFNLRKDLVLPTKIHSNNNINKNNFQQLKINNNSIISILI